MRFLRGDIIKHNALGMVCCLRFLLATAVPNAFSAEPPSPITTISNYLSRPPSAGTLQEPIRLQATVTYSDPQWKTLSVQDETGAAFVHPSSQRLGIEAGELLLIEGIRTPQMATNLSGVFQDVIIRRIGRAPSPKPAAATAAELLSRGYNARLVEAAGTVRSAAELGRLQLVLVDGSRRFPVWVRHHEPADLLGLLDAQVTVQGVCLQATDGAGVVTNFSVLLADFKSVRVDKRGPSDPFALPLTSLDKVLSLQGGLGEPRRSRVQGLVVRQDPDNSVLLQDGNGQVLVRSLQRTQLARDDRIEAVGFLALEGTRAVMEDACFRMVEPSHSTTIISAKADSTLPALTTIKQILELTREQARQHYPVRVTAVVTLFEGPGLQLFIQDGDDAIYVDRPEPDLRLRRGQLVEVSGVTVEGGVLTMIAPAKIEVVGEGVLPEPVDMTFQQGLSASYDCRRVRVKGTVQSSSMDEGHLWLDLAAADGHFPCNVPCSTNSPLPGKLLNSVVEIVGTCMVQINELGAPIGVTVAIDREGDIDIKEEAPASSAGIAPHRIGDVLRFMPPNVASRRLKVTGTITLWRPGGESYLQDGTGGIRVEPSRVVTHETNNVDLGDEVEVVGFRALGECTPVLKDAVLRTLRKGTMPTPKRLSVTDVLSVTNNNELVQIDARVLETVPASLAPELLLEEDEVLFYATMERSGTGRLAPAWEAGTRVRVTGVCFLRADETQKPRSFRLLLRSPSDVVVLSKPSWFTARRVLGISTLLVVAVLGSLGWIAALRGRVRQQTELIRQRLEREATLEARYRELVENANDVIVTCDLEGRILAINRAGERVLGYDRSEALQMSVQDMVVPEHRAKAVEFMRNGGAKVISGAYELDVQTKTGQRLTLELSTRLVRSGDTVTGFESIARDVTDRKRAEERLRTSEAELAAAQRIGHVGSWDFTIATRTLHLSSEATRLFELGETPRLTVRAVLSRVHPDDRRTVRDALKRAARGEGAVGLDQRLLLPDGRERSVYIRVEAEADAQGRRVRLHGTIQDISERRGLETQLHQAQKMESIGQLAAGVAHDFNNLLTVIQGNTSLLMADRHLSKESAEGLEQIGSSAQRAAELTRQLLLFSRKQILQPRLVDINDVVASTVKMLQRVLGEHIQLDIRCANPLPTVKADPGMISQVIMNLAVNARDAMATGGRLVIGTSRAELDDSASLTLAEARPGSFVVLSVQDTGSGMSQSTIEHLFEPFFTTKGVGKGTGLGLSTVYGIVRQHGGIIKVASRLGEGTTFDVYLPVDGGPKDAPAVPREATEPKNGQGTVLIVEDERSLRQLAIRVLRRHGYQVLEASSGKEALAVWAEHSAEIDLLLTDMVMPDGISGGELAKRLSDEKPSLKIVYSSGYSPELLDTGALLEEGVNFLSKPYMPAALIQTLRNSFEHDRRGVPL